MIANNIALNLQAGPSQGVSAASACGVLDEVVHLSLAAGDTVTALYALVFLGDTEVARGRLRRAEDVYRRALHLADEHGLKVSTLGTAQVGLGTLSYEWNQLEEAESHLLRGVAFLRLLGQSRLPPGGLSATGAASAVTWR